MMLTGPLSGAWAHGSCAASHCGQLSWRRPDGTVVDSAAPSPEELGTITTATPSGTASDTSGQRVSCTTSTFARLSLSTWATSSPRQCQLIGTPLAPRGTVATEASRNSIELRSRSATRSPAPTPRSASPLAARRASVNSSS